MSRLVDSMLKVFKREKKGRKGDPSKAKKRNKSVLEADSFVFVSGATESQYWGRILNDDHFPTQLEELGSRRNTHIGLVQSDESNGLQEVNLIISPSIQDENEGLVLNTKVFNRRLSGTLVKARKSTDEVEDGPVIRDYAFLLSARERLSQELSGRYVYDRLIRSPLLSNQPRLWKYPAGGGKSPPESKHKEEKEKAKDELISRLTCPLTSTPAKEKHLLRVDHGFPMCNIRDAQSSRGDNSLKGVELRPNSEYSNLDLKRSTMGSEYAMPTDAILNWEHKTRSKCNCVVMSSKSPSSVQCHLELHAGERGGREGTFYGYCG